MTRASVIVAYIWTVEEEGMGANPRAHGAEDRRPARERMKPFMMLIYVDVVYDILKIAIERKR